MNIQTDKEKLVFRYETTDGKVLYSLGLTRKNKEGNYEHGYISARFPKEADIPNKSKIKIYEAWLDFYLKDKTTNPYIFINKYELIENESKVVEEKEEKIEESKEVQLDDNDLPF